MTNTLLNHYWTNILRFFLKTWSAKEIKQDNVTKTESLIWKYSLGSISFQACVIGVRTNSISVLILKAYIPLWFINQIQSSVHYYMNLSERFHIIWQFVFSGLRENLLLGYELISHVMQIENWNLITFYIFYSRSYQHSRRRACICLKVTFGRQLSYSMLSIIKQVFTLRKTSFLTKFTKKWKQSF